MDSRCLSSYRILSVPRFASDEIDNRAYDSLIGQRALWNALVFHLVHKHKISVELRISSLDRDRGLDVSLRFLGNEATPEVLKDITQVEALLPPEYTWEKRDVDANEMAGAWRVARVVRKLEYIDLPALSPHTLRMGGNALRSSTNSSAASNRGASAPNPQETSLASMVLGAAAERGRPLKELPLPTAMLNDLYSRRYAMALPGQIDEVRPRQRTLYQAFQDSDSGIVSFCLHPVDEALLDDARVHALNWKRFLDPFAQDIASSGFAELQHLRESYDRYSLPASYLANVTIRVASLSDERSTSLANVVAAYLGGAKAFRVYTPTKDSLSEALTRKAVDVPCLQWDHNRIEMARDNILGHLEDQSIDRPDNEDILDFLSLMPHVYTIEEAERILRLPFAYEEGLPGLDSSLVPPFTIPSLNFTPVSNGVGEVVAPPDGKIRVGMVAQGKTSLGDEAQSAHYAGKSWHTISKNDLTKHALIVGSTGSGKTMTTLFMVREFARNKIPFMVVEPVKTEYYQRLKPFLGKSLYRARFEDVPDVEKRSPSYKRDSETRFFSFDPMHLLKGVTVARHAAYLKSCFEAAFALPPWAALILENGILKYYVTSASNGGCGLDIFDKGNENTHKFRGNDIDKGLVYPSFQDFSNFFLDYFLPEAFAVRGVPKEQRYEKLSSSAKEIYQFYERRFDALKNGVLGRSFSQATSNVRAYHKNGKKGVSPIGGIFAQTNVNWIVELDGLTDPDQKSLAMAFFLTALFELRQANDAMIRESGKVPDSNLRHVLILEEAHRLLANTSRGARGGDLAGQDSKAKAVSMFVDMLAEIRAFGQGIMIVEQIPTKIAPEAVKNTNLKIMLRLTSKDDRDYLGEAMNFTENQKRFVTNLRAQKGEGVNYVVFGENIDQPLMLQLPLPMSVNHDWLYDDLFCDSVLQNSPAGFGGEG